MAAPQRAVDAAFVVGSSCENLESKLALVRFLGAMLQAQLTANASLNAALLSKGATKKSSTTPSYLFSAKDANALDSDAVFHLAKSAFAAHAAIRENIRAFEEALFSQAAKVVDRTRLTTAENKRLDEIIGGCLLVLSCDLLESSASKLIEWLVRHFRWALFDFNGASWSHERL